MNARTDCNSRLLPLLLVAAFAAWPQSLSFAEPQVTVNLAQPGAEISPYVYGQFIEHLGRCIRDGIWAEKLVDRKFLLEPGKSWEVVKPEGAAFDAFLDTAGAYAGDRALALWVRDAKGGPCGVRQGGIGLVEGKDYVGYAVLAQAAGSSHVEIRLAWGDRPEQGQTIVLKDVGREYKSFPFRFRAGATTDAAALSLTLGQPGHLWAACLSLMPADNVRGMRADTLDLVRKLAPPITRWPGGNFVSGYDWKDGIGPRDRRPPRWERAWNAVEDNDFGIDEFMDFCREVKTEPLVVVNTGLGSVEEAAAEVEYANGTAESRWGGERAKSGHREPYGVVWWGVGNEMYGDWQLGNVPVERYAVRHNAFADAMRRVDPRVKLIAVGSPGKWNDVVVPACAGHMDLLAAHHYTERKFRTPLSPADAAKYGEGFLQYSDSVAAGVRGLVADFRKRQKDSLDKLGRLRMAIDEWGIVRDWNQAPDGPGVGAFEHYYTMGDAVAVARALHEILRAADVVGMANWPQTVNVIGAIKTTRNHAALDPVGHVLALYRARLGGRLVPVRTPADLPLDAVAAHDAAGKVTSVALVNYSPRDALRVSLGLAPDGTKAQGSAWRIDGPELGSINVPGQPEAVTTKELAGPIAPGKPLELPPHSITVVQFGE